MIACTVTIGRHTYAGLFPSTCAALMDALARFPAARGICVKARP